MTLTGDQSIRGGEVRPACVIKYGDVFVPSPEVVMAVKDISDMVALQAIHNKNLYPAVQRIASDSMQPMKVARRKLEQLIRKGLVTGFGSFPSLTDTGLALVEDQDPTQ